MNDTVKKTILVFKLLKSKLKLLYIGKTMFLYYSVFVDDDEWKSHIVTSETTNSKCRLHIAFFTWPQFQDKRRRLCPRGCAPVIDWLRWPPWERSPVMIKPQPASVVTSTMVLLMAFVLVYSTMMAWQIFVSGFVLVWHVNRSTRIGL